MKKKDEVYTTNAYGMPTDSKRKTLDMEEDTGSALARRQNSYGKFFEGYTERKVLVKGRSKIIRVYSGTIYRQELTEKKARQIRLFYAALFSLAVFLFVLALCIPTPSNNSWYVTLSAFVTAVFYARVFLSLHTYVWSKRDFTIYEYGYGSIALQKRPVYAACTVLIPICVGMVMLILSGLPFSLFELLRDVLLVCSGAVIYILKKIESRIEYTTIEADENRLQT